MAAVAATKQATKHVRIPEQPWANTNVLNKYNINNILKSNNIIQPKFWYGNYNNAIPKHTYTIDCTKYQNNVNLNNTSLIEEMKHIYNETGLVYLTNTALTDLAGMNIFVHFKYIICMVNQSMF